MYVYVRVKDSVTYHVYSVFLTNDTLTQKLLWSRLQIQSQSIWLWLLSLSIKPTFFAWEIKELINETEYFIFVCTLLRQLYWQCSDLHEDNDDCDHDTAFTVYPGIGVVITECNKGGNNDDCDDDNDDSQDD